jgi:hypothetical protein
VIDGGRSQKLLEFLLHRFPAAQVEIAIVALTDGDPDHDAEWWAARIERLIELEEGERGDGEIAAQ